MSNIADTVLVIVDVQGRLAHIMQDKDTLFKNLRILIQAAQQLEIPILCTEQVPEKIGPTIPNIIEVLDSITPIPKMSFSCFKEEEFLKQLKDSGRNHVIVTGIEAHVCVYQTVKDLIQNNFLVEIVIDAISSRSTENLRIAIDRMREEGARTTCTEMAVCEWIQTSVHPNFREILSLIK